MPTTCWTVQRVMVVPTRKPGVNRYEIVERATERPGRIYHALDPWIGALCERAAQSGETVALTWRGTRYGELVYHARLLQSGEMAFERALAQDRV